MAGTAACQVVPPQAPADPVAQEPEATSPPEPLVDYRAEPGLTSTARLAKLVSFLETGDAARARIELAAFEVEGGDQEAAAYWQKQIEGDPEAIFEDDGTVHEIRPGESLSSISRKFLGDPLQFYLLARFNEIENPGQIVAGQKIRIPKVRLVPLASPSATEPEPSNEAGPLDPTTPDPEFEPPPSGEPRPVPAISTQPGVITAKDDVPLETDSNPPVTSSAPARSPAPSQTGVPSSEAPAADDSIFATPPEAFEEAADSVEQGRMERAIALLEDGLARYPGNQKVRRAAVLAYAKHGEFLLANGKPEQAAVTLAKAVDLDPNDPTVTTQLQEVRNRIQAEAFYQKGLGLRDGGDREAALAAFGKALEIAPDFRDAQDQFAVLQSEIVDQLQGQAVRALRQEDFPTALKLWKRVLDIDPTNGTADRYYKHTLELQGRLAAPESE